MDEPNRDRNQAAAAGLSAGSRAGCYIVGVGASAGGLEALEKMFHTMPSNTGMAFVIVQHLSPDFKSLMDELLRRHTQMPIYRVQDGMQVEPDSLYLIPPKQEMIISDGRLLLTEKDPDRSLSLPIDHFFRSLAQDVGQRAIGIVLSGTGSDGSRGIRDISEAGGLVLSQSSESAKFDGMPRSAIDTGVVDLVMEPAEIPELLVRYAEDPEGSRLDQRQAIPVDESSIETIFRLLQQRHRIDFKYYKPSTIGRRIERRIQLNHYANIDEYVQRLEDDPSEVDQLYKDLLIGVTRFFRDLDAFSALRKDIVPHLLSREGDGAEFRIWVAACGTGEEAYSMAIVLDECMRALNKRLNVKIFATDVHQASLDAAHAGIYQEESLREIAASLRQRYFTKVDAGYQIAADIRKMIVFAPHDLVKDAPFTRMHLITCRNFLIYLRAAAQKKVLSLFHFGLRTGGLLFLGASESPGELSDEFETLNERWRIFRKRRDVRLLGEFSGPFDCRPPNFLEHHPPAQPRGSIVRDRSLLAIYDELLEQYMPSAILVDEQGRVSQTFGGASKYLKHADGRMSTSLLDLVEGDLKLVMPGALQKAEKEHQTITCERIRAQTPNGDRYLRIEVNPVRKPMTGSKFLITFEEDELDQPETKTALATEMIDLGKVSLRRVEQLEEELRYSKESLQAAIEELETSNEELQAMNEELVASNEELQSTNEELHSVNEELYTVNAEYQKKISELTEMTDDMDNLLVSTEVHTLFLDKRLCVRKFTPKIAEVFNLVPHDLGRRFDAFAHNIICSELTPKVEEVLETGELYEERVQDNHGNYFLMRVLPYRAQDCVSGVVLTLIEVSSLVAAQAQAVREREQLERVIDANRDGIWDWPDVSQDEMWWSPACYTLLGYEPGAFPARHSEWLRLIHEDDRDRIQETSVPGQEKCFVDLHRDFEYRMQHESGEYRWFRHRATVDADEAGRPVRITGSVADIHDRKLAEMQNVEAIRRRDNFLAMLSHELRNPMGAVLNAIDCLQTDLEAGKEFAMSAEASRDATSRRIGSFADATTIIERQTRHMARLLDDLLDVSRFGQAKFELRKQVIDLCELADDVVQSVSHQFKSKDQLLHTSVCDSSLNVFADPTRIKQAQVNLLMNASKYSPEMHDVWYDIEREGDEAVITVRDQGDGIPSDLLGKIFDLFTQSEATLARSSGGMGVGLSLARSIAEVHHGSISVESDGPGEGSTFRIRLPITDKPRERKRLSSNPPVGGQKLLLVEDNHDARTMLVKTLRLQGFEVVDASDGQSALNLFRSFKPDVAIIDIGLPLMNGYELARAIRQLENPSQTTLIALTGYGRQADREMAIDAGFDAHLVKPLNPKELLAIVHRHQQVAAQASK